MKYKLMINISNHPSTGWSSEQLEAVPAERLVDITHPNIPPQADLDEVSRIAFKVLGQVFSDYIYGGDRLQRTQVCVHLMGETSFVVSLASLLKINSIDAFCSTTKRIVVENPDGTKTSKFSFVRFRQL